MYHFLSRNSFFSLQFITNNYKEQSLFRWYCVNISYFCKISVVLNWLDVTCKKKNFFWLTTTLTVIKLFIYIYIFHDIPVFKNVYLHQFECNICHGLWKLRRLSVLLVCQNIQIYCMLEHFLFVQNLNNGVFNLYFFQKKNVIPLLRQHV